VKDFDKQIEIDFLARKFLAIFNLCNMKTDAGKDRFSISFKIALAHFVLAGGLAASHDKAIMSRAQEFIAAAIKLSSIVGVNNDSYEDALALSILIDYAITRDFDRAQKRITKARKDNNHGYISPVWDFISALIYFYSGEIVNAKQSAQRACKGANGNERALTAIFWFLSLINKESSYAQSAFISSQSLISPPDCLWLFFMNDEDIRRMAGNYQLVM